jgi:phosphoribosylformylglycinamidine cyclo-ligase
MADACAENGVALIGGETAEMPGLYADGEYDAAGFIVGEVAPERLVDGSRVSVGDVLLGLPAVGLHTNGYSLARRIAGVTGEPEHDRTLLARPLPGGQGESIGDALMAEHPTYLPAITPALDAGLINGMAHITGGGLLDNVPRMLPETAAAEFDRESWPVPPVFDYLVSAGDVGERERFQVFNMGLGFVFAVPAGREREAQAMVPGSLVVGRVIPRGDDDETVRGLP